MKTSINRKCIATGRILPTSKLIRIVKTKSGQILVDSDVPGRGAYISRDLSLFDKVNNQRLLNKTFRTNINREVYEKLKEKLKEE